MSGRERDGVWMANDNDRSGVDDFNRRQSKNATLYLCFWYNKYMFIIQNYIHVYLHNIYTCIMYIYIIIYP